MFLCRPGCTESRASHLELIQHAEAARSLTALVLSCSSRSCSFSAATLRARHNGQSYSSCDDGPGDRVTRRGHGESGQHLRLVIRTAPSPSSTASDRAATHQRVHPSRQRVEHRWLLQRTQPRTLRRLNRILRAKPGHAAGNSPVGVEPPSAPGWFELSHRREPAPIIVNKRNVRPRTSGLKEYAELEAARYHGGWAPKRAHVRA